MEQNGSIPHDFGVAGEYMASRHLAEYADQFPPLVLLRQATGTRSLLGVRMSLEPAQESFLEPGAVNGSVEWDIKVNREIIGKAFAQIMFWGGEYSVTNFGLEFQNPRSNYSMDRALSILLALLLQAGFTEVSTNAYEGSPFAASLARFEFIKASRIESDNGVVCRFFTWFIPSLVRKHLPFLDTSRLRLKTSVPRSLLVWLEQQELDRQIHFGEMPYGY